MGKAERNRKQSARERIEAQRAATRRAQARRRVLLAGGSVLAVIAVVVAVIVVRLSQSPPKPGGTVTSTEYATQLTTVPASVFDAVGPGTATGLSAITGRSPLTQNGKPEVLFIGGEYCPYCGAQRWAIAAALSRFGRWRGFTSSIPRRRTCTRTPRRCRSLGRATPARTCPSFRSNGTRGR